VNENGLIVLPVSLEPYSSVIFIAFLAFDGLLLGVAAKKAAVSVILIIAGVVLAAYVGLNIPLPTMSYILNLITSFFVTQAAGAGALLYALPAFWILGFAVGLWKG
jgi:hypothetical protein